VGGDDLRVEIATRQVAKLSEVPIEAWGGWAVRAFPTCDEMPLLTVCCRKAFCSLKVPLLMKLCKPLELKPPYVAQMAAVIETLLKGILKIPDERIASVLERRIAALSAQEGLANGEATVLETMLRIACASSTR